MSPPWKKPLSVGSKPVRQPVARQAAAIVRRIAVLEPVRQDEIDDLVLRASRAR